MRRKLKDPAQAAHCGVGKNLNCIVIHGCPIQGFYIFLQSVDLKSLGYARHYRLLKELDVSFPPPFAGEL